jgi:hypothetical protein
VVGFWGIGDFGFQNRCATDCGLVVLISGFGIRVCGGRAEVFDFSLCVSLLGFSGFAGLKI